MSELRVCVKGCAQSLRSLIPSPHSVKTATDRSVHNGRQRIKAESLAELIMLGPKDQWAPLMAEAIRHLGNTLLEDIEGTATDTTH